MWMKIKMGDYISLQILNPQILVEERQYWRLIANQFVTVYSLKKI